MGYRIGLILGTKTTGYPRMIRLGVQNTLENTGHTLVCLSDLVPYHTHANVTNYIRVVFELARRMDLDAVIVPLGTTSGYLDNDPVLTNKMIQLLDPRTTLVMEREVPGFRCITKDSKAGMSDCIRYLIEEAKLTRIAFISGSATSKGAQDREAAYFAQMAAHDLDVPEGYFVRGDFSGQCRDVVEHLIDEHPDIEAIACASDQIAFTVYDVLRERRIEIGRDIAVTGFDGHENSEHLDPPLATVNMTGYDFGCMAAREVLRLCQGLPQQEKLQTGDFVPRESCGAPAAHDVSRLIELLQQEPFPIDDIVSIFAASSLQMAGPEMTKRFQVPLKALVLETRRLFFLHMAHPEQEVQFVSSITLSEIFSPAFQAHFSLEGFHTAVISLLKAIAYLHPDQIAWLTEQESLLHLHIARLLDENMKQEVLNTNIREWLTIHLTEDAIREDSQPQEACRLMLAELNRIGVRWAELFLVPDVVIVNGMLSFALSDTLRYVASLRDGQTRVEDSSSVALQELLQNVLSRHPETQLCTVGGILAGDELMAVLIMDGGTLDDNGQLIAMLNMGLALKHLQTMASIREMNEILSRNNLLLARQSQHDELTGLLNRRSLHDKMLDALLKHEGAMAALLYLDLDGLKYINDTFGHDAGDVAIKATARALQESLPADCLLARMGGDEFVAFSLVQDETEAQGLVTAIKHGLLHANQGRELREAPYELVLSIGLQSFVAGDDCEADIAQALMQADEHMYEAKQRHRQSPTYHGRS